MNNVNEHDIELKRFFKEMPITTAEITIGFKKLTDTAIIPAKAHPTDSGFDLYADETVIIEPGATVVVKTGIAIVLPQGYEASVRPRSGITSRTKLRVQLGTVDNAYRGDIGIIVDNVHDWYGEYETVDYGFNLQQEKVLCEEDYPGGDYYYGTYIVRKGDKLAQLVVSPVAMFAGVEVDDVGETDRGSSGFGSTGVTTKEDE